MLAVRSLLSVLVLYIHIFNSSLAAAPRPPAPTALEQHYYTRSGGPRPSLRPSLQVFSLAPLLDHALSPLPDHSLINLNSSCSHPPYLPIPIQRGGYCVCSNAKPSGYTTLLAITIEHDPSNSRTPGSSRSTKSKCPVLPDPLEYCGYRLGGLAGLKI